MNLCSLAEWLIYVRRECEDDRQFQRLVGQWAMALTDEESIKHLLEEKFL